MYRLLQSIKQFLEPLLPQGDFFVPSDKFLSEPWKQSTYQSLPFVKISYFIITINYTHHALSDAWLLLTKAIKTTRSKLRKISSTLIYLYYF